MKKLLLTCLSVVYLLMSIGAGIHVHYCMGQLVSASIGPQKDRCSRCGMTSKKGCCEEKRVSLTKRVPDHLPGKLITVIQPYSAPVVLNSALSIQSYQPLPVLREAALHSFRVCPIPLHIMHSVYRI
jgi:hypothetical protein